ncbi:hypothetical protein THRCLA_20202 [Thraustotheca clavata]|uniref:Uncharacterized protein n=1 Tax=Thraustotheca clavata TaxID=74557 RepID=A0A1W0AA56_9STRA|nr:hypothetical protein THRCLA_20202 [Thraustotheca clavata]
MQFHYYSNGGMVPGWQVSMENVHFDSFDDCMGNIHDILLQTAANPINTYTDGTSNYSSKTYSGNIKIGDSYASINLTLPFALAGNYNNCTQIGH